VFGYCDCFSEQFEKGGESVVELVLKKTVLVVGQEVGGIHHAIIYLHRMVSVPIDSSHPIDSSRPIHSSRPIDIK